MRSTGIADQIRLELSRKRFADMRWEEVWDAALRIRNTFLTTPLPRQLYGDLSRPLLQRFCLCGLCVDPCPTKPVTAIDMSHDYELAKYARYEFMTDMAVLYEGHERKEYKK